MTKKIILISFVLTVTAIVIISGCDPRIVPPQAVKDSDGKLGDTSYVEIFPPWNVPGSPNAILIGNDQLIYVADYENNQIHMMDAGGRILMSKDIMHPQAIAQNSKLDLYVCAETINPKTLDTMGAIFRINLVRWDTIYISGIKIDTLLHDTSYVYRDTSYFFNHNLAEAHTKLVYSEPARPQRRFVGIGILPGNGFLVARTGNDNSSFVDPDARVLRFKANEEFETPIGDLVTRASGGTAITDIRDPSGIMVFPSSNDFILTQNSSQDAYGAIWMVYYETNDFRGWLPKFDPAKSAQSGVDFIRPRRYINATAATYDKRRREVFILDSELDSVVKFSVTGQFKSESFGKSNTARNGLPAMNNPQGIAYSNDCTLYIADTGNRMIRRFRLSTQMQCN
ncbi:MAG: hypothetical protein HY964_00495 [Ignavibacteriales bacterium]|nr:hypothetical protein [Ignavibacteriales bacterium]